MPVNKRERINNMSQEELITLVNSQRDYIYKQDSRVNNLIEIKEQETFRANSNLQDYDYILKKYTSLKRKYKQIKRMHIQLGKAYVDKLELLVERYSNG